MNTEMNVVEVTETCEKHGDYKFKRFLIDGKKGVGAGRCPKCASEHLAETQRREASIEDAETKRRNKWCAEYLERQIPRRFENSSFANFNTAIESQIRAKSICQSYANKFTEKMLVSGGGLILAGNPGTGKTHLALAIGRHVAPEGCKVIYRNMTNLIREIRATWGEAAFKEEELLNNYKHIDLLIVDEVGVQSGSDNEKNIFFEIINGRYENRKPTIVISNCTTEEITGYIGERAKDRITEGGAVIPFSWNSHRESA